MREEIHREEAFRDTVREKVRPTLLNFRLLCLSLNRGLKLSSVGFGKLVEIHLRAGVDCG